MNKFIVFIIATTFVNHYNPSLLGFIWQKDGAFNNSGSAKVLLFVHHEFGASCDVALAYLKSNTSMSLINPRS